MAFLTIKESRRSVFMTGTTQMVPRIGDAIANLKLPSDPLLLNDGQIEALWGILADVSLNYDEDGSTLLPIEGSKESTSEPCLDEGFWVWSRGTSQMEVWEWFDEHHSLGLAYLVHGVKTGQEQG